jgi:lipopolysaccharide transport system permease protein
MRKMLEMPEAAIGERTMADEALAEGSLQPETVPAREDTEARLPPADSLATVVIERRSGWRFIDLGELWRYRELLFFLAWRDIKVRYKQTVLGAAWVVLQPLAMMVVFSLFFGRVASRPSADVPYPLFVLAGLLPWFFFSNGVSSASQSIVGSQSLVTKVYFPRLIIPLGAIGAGLVDFAVALGMLLVLMPFYAVWPGLGILLVPLLALSLVVTAAGVGILLSALTVAYRDFRHVVPFMVQLWMFATPAVYMQAEGLIGPSWRPLLALNPAHGLIVNFRAAVLGGDLDLYALVVSGAVSLGLLVIGCLYFRRVERSFADII